MAAGQAGIALHTMAILQAYQADVLKEMDEGDGLTPEAVKELRKATDLASLYTVCTRLYQVHGTGCRTLYGGLGRCRAPLMAESHRFERRKNSFFPRRFPSLKLGCLGRQSALWWRNFDLLSCSRLPLGSSCLGGRGTPLTPPPPPCPESARYRERSPLSEAAPWLIPLRPWSGEPAANHCPTDNLAGRPSTSAPSSRS